MEEELLEKIKFGFKDLGYNLGSVSVYNSYSCTFHGCTKDNDDNIYDITVVKSNKNWEYIVEKLGIRDQETLY